MAKPKRHIWLGICMFTIFLISCNAPHNNPLDPQNPNVTWASLHGTIQTNTAPAHYVSGAILRWRNQRATSSDDNGQYLFEKLNPQDGWLYFSKSGFLQDSMWIEWNGRTRIEQNITLRRNPRLSGRVQTERVPRQPIADVKVTWHPGQEYVYTDQAGYFIFENPFTGQGLLTFEKPGYRAVEYTVELPENKDASQDAFMNADPQLENFTLNTAVQNFYPPKDATYEMNAKAVLTDMEGDIDSVYIENSEFGIKAYLDYDVLEKVFERTFTERDLGLNSMREIVGVDLTLNVVDRSGFVFDVGQQHVVRLIRDEVELESPIDNDPVSKQVKLKWFYFDPEFNFTYLIRVYTNEEYSRELVWEQSMPPSDSTFVVAQLDRLTNYLWEVWCIDDYNNRSRSKPGSFRVEQ